MFRLHHRIPLPLLLLIQVDASNIYGEDLARQHQLRLHEDGKMKYQVMW